MAILHALVSHLPLACEPFGLFRIDKNDYRAYPLGLDFDVRTGWRSRH